MLKSELGLVIVRFPDTAVANFGSQVSKFIQVTIHGGHRNAEATGEIVRTAGSVLPDELMNSFQTLVVFHKGVFHDEKRI